ncbi:MAG TPA: DUF3450 family protein [Candidatus Polarisedimenticolia bacterium]|nr:DUF3450 family protein [Candidatus Polarisedimenticolia bacterium]
MRMRLTATILLAALAAGPSQAAQEPGRQAGEPIEDARSALSRWVETQEILSRERKEWREARQLLESRVEALRREVSLAEERAEEAEKGRTDASRARAELMEDRRAIQEIAGELAERMEGLERGVRALYQPLPPVLTEKVRPLYERMPAEPSAAGISLAERFQNVLGILAELNRLNAEITMATEVRALSDGRPSEVRTVYLGLGQAYYVSAGGEAGVGRPGDAGWVWEAEPSLAPRINEVLDILNNKSSPRFVPLPVTLR